MIAELKSLNVSRSTEYIVTRILQKHGQFTRIKYARPLKFRKEFEEVNFGFKITEGVFRIGADYENLKSTKEKRAEGQEPTGLKNINWLIHPYLLKGLDNKILVRLYTVPNSSKKTTYELNGQPVEKESLRDFCLASEFSSHETPCINLDVENILEIS